jgi:CIC family chloride channel protein
MNLSPQTKELFFLLLAIAIGDLAGMGTLGFLALIEVWQWGAWPGDGHFMARVLSAPWWLRILIPALGGLAVGPVTAFWAPEARGPGVPEVIESETLRERHISPRMALLKAWCTVKIEDVLTAYNQRLLKDQTFRPSGPGPETSV